MSRARIALQAEEVIAGRLAFRDFLLNLPDDIETEDQLVSELVDLLEHEPKVDGFLGVSAEEHQKYMSRAYELIALLKTS